MGLLRIKPVTPEQEETPQKRRQKGCETPTRKRNWLSAAGEGCCQKSLFLLFKIGKLRWTAMCSLLWVYYRITFYGAEWEGTKSLWGTDSPLNLQKIANTFHNGQIMLTCLCAFCKWRLIKHLLKQNDLILVAHMLKICYPLLVCWIAIGCSMNWSRSFIRAVILLPSLWP